MSPHSRAAPWDVRTLYEDGRFTVYWHAKCGYSAYDREGGIHLWGGRTVWSILIAIAAEARSVSRC